jgi:hypothetical protein
MLDTLTNLDASSMRGKATPLDPASIPGFIPRVGSDGFDPNKFRIRYLKLDLDELGDITELERLETKAIRNQGIFILSKDRFNFMDKIFILVQFLEKIAEE